MRMDQATLLRFADECKKAAAQMYEQTESGQFRVKLTTSFSEAASFGLSELSLFSDSSLNAQIRDELDSVDLRRFNSYAEGSSSYVFVTENPLGQRFALRKGGSDGLNRSKSPRMLQPCKQWGDEYSGSVELLPLVAMLDISFGTPAFPDFQKEKTSIDVDCLVDFLGDADCRSYVGLRDVAMLPNGSPILVDPGFVEDLETLEQQIERMRDIMNDDDFPEALRLVEADGTLTQDKYFPNPFGDARLA